MPLPPWPEFALFMALVLVTAIYVIVVSGHFPGAYRADAFRTPIGTAIIWSTIAVMALSAAAAAVFAYSAIPWHAAVIGGGLMILAAPLAVQPFPDRFVDGRSVLLLLASFALALDFAAWRLMG